MLASNGWRKASKKTIKGDHAEHIHSGCDCEFAIRFDGKPDYAGYDPEKYRAMYDNAEGDTWKEKLNSVRREDYAKNKDKINAQKRDAYARRNNTEYSGVPKSWKRNGVLSEDEVLKGTNPKYRSDLPAHLVGSKEDYKNNCANCVVAYSMRKKGYVVTAKSVGECGTLRHNNKIFKAWKGRTPTIANGNGMDEIIEYMKDCKDGSLIVITVKMPYSVFNPLPGHAFVAEKIGGEVLFLDPQTGRHYNMPEEIFSTVKLGETRYMRVDDLEITDLGVSACKEV